MTTLDPIKSDLRIIKNSRLGTKRLLILIWECIGSVDYLITALSFAVFSIAGIVSAVWFHGRHDMVGQTLYYISLYFAICLPIGLLWLSVIDISFLLARRINEDKEKAIKSGLISSGIFNPSERRIRIFISSTFSDMQDVRDYLMLHIFPYLKRVASERNVELSAIDLRWGITDEEAKSGRTVGLCLDEIDRSSPFFIGILGDRYGWTPDTADFSKDELLKTKHPLVTPALSEGISITELEIKYGAEWRDNGENAIVFIPPPGMSSAVINPKQGMLLRWIIDNNSIRHKTYDDKYELGKKIENWALGILDKYYPETDVTTTVQLHTDVSCDVDEYICKYLDRAGKRLSATQMQLISASAAASSKGVLDDMLDELISFGKFELLDKKISEITALRDTVSLYDYLLRSAERHFGRSVVKATAKVLLHADSPLPVGTIIKKASDSNWMLDSSKVIEFINNFNGVSRKSGQSWYFKNNHWRTASERRYLNGKD